ncbi:hypothetical protein E2C01_059317 [Portunus trituberculatus]|uniref:Uncharacterized protein n=1 Tax=Portunus trituberculatus TaxID=210409 RepID=A0A5B7H789_PORTR|nr:hypothetical protein [Portunus trituberculatus]
MFCVAPSALCHAASLGGHIPSHSPPQLHPHLPYSQTPPSHCTGVRIGSRPAIDPELGFRKQHSHLPTPTLALVPAVARIIAIAHPLNN